MVFTAVLKTFFSSDFSTEQYKEKLEKHLETLKFEKLGAFHVQCIVFQSHSSTTVYQFLHSDYPATCFSVIEQQNDTKVLAGDIGLSFLQRRLCELGILVERKQLNMECFGSSYKLGDFQVKIGVVTHNSSNRGLVVEISYACGSTNYDSFGIISELIQSTFGWNIQDNKQSYLTNHMRRKQFQTVYCPEDTILQYFEIFTGYRQNK